MTLSKHYKDTLTKLPTFTKKQLDDIHLKERDAFARFKGQIHELESAIGLLRIGHFIGWRCLLIVHNKRTIKKYEAILNIDVRTYFPEEGPVAHRLQGFNMYKKLGQFWKIVSGDIKIEHRKAKL